MTKEQLEQLVLEAYSARKEIRSYLEYFLAPDPDKLYEKAVAEIVKEAQRGKRGRSKARISVIRKTIADFASYQPGEEYVLRLRLAAIRELLVVSRRTRMSDTLIRGFVKLIDDCIKEADAAAMVTPALASLRELSDSDLGSSAFRSLIHKALV